MCMCVCVRVLSHGPGLLYLMNGLRPYLFDFMLLRQKWLANEVGRSR